MIYQTVSRFIPGGDKVEIYPYIPAAGQNHGGSGGTLAQIPAPQRQGGAPQQEADGRQVQEPWRQRETPEQYLPPQRQGGAPQQGG